MASGLAGIAIGIGAYYLLPVSYTSEALMQVVPARIPEALTGVDDTYLDPVPPAMREVLLSRVMLATIVRQFELYRNARARRPIEDVIKVMREAIRIEPAGDSTFRVAFTYSVFPRNGGSRLAAQRVTQEVVTRLIDGNARNQRELAYQTHSYFEDRSNSVGARWEELNAQLQGLSSTDPRYERLALDRDLARKEYGSLRQKQSAAQGLVDLVSRRQAKTLALVDPPSLPVRPNVPMEQMALAGLLSGIGLAILVRIGRAIRASRREMLPAGAAI